MSEPMLRAYRDGDDEGILDCLTAAFGSWPGVEIDVSPLDHLRWKMSSSSLARKLHFVIEDNGRIVGTRLLIAQQALVKGVMLGYTKFVDLSIDQNYRGRGLMRRLWNAGESAAQPFFQMSIGLTGKPPVAAMMQEYGHRRPANTVYHMKCPVAARMALPDKRFAIGRTVCFDDRVEGLFARVALHFDVITVRSKTYLNWRYADPRAGRSVIYVAEAERQMLGYIVVSPSRARAFIADLLVLPERADVLSALIEEALAYCADEGLESLRCWGVRNHPYRAALLDAGFGPVREEDGVMYMPYGHTDLNFAFEDERARLHIVPGDTDLV